MGSRNLKSLSMSLCAIFSAAMIGGAYGHDARHRDEDHLGEWIGTWNSGADSGAFDLALERASDGKLTGNIDVSTDGGKASEFAVDLRNISFEGDSFTATFVTPGKTPETVKLSGSLNKQAGNGQWLAYPNATGTAPESGTWKLEKHEGK